MQAMRAFPDGTVDPAAYDRAARQRSQMPAARWLVRRNGSLTAPRWAFVGPKGIHPRGRRYNGTDPTAGRVNATAFHPRDARTYYVAAAGGGVWKTTNGGTHWTPMSDGPEWKFQQVSSLAVDPKQTSTVYAGTGDFHRGLFDNILAHGFGVMKSTNGGVNWTALGADRFGNEAISKIVLDPRLPKVVTVSTGHGQDTSGNETHGKVWRSADGGLTWAAVVDQAADWNDVAISAPNGSGQVTYYACGISKGGELWRAKPGRPFRKLRLPEVTAPAGRVNIYTHLDVACSPTSPGTLYILFVQSWFVPGGGVNGRDQLLFKSTDYGNSWRNTTNNFPMGGAQPGDQQNFEFEDYTFCIACTHDRRGRDVVYVGLVDLVRSPDGGRTWGSIGGPVWAAPGGVPLARTHGDQHSIAVNPRNSQELLLGNDGGVYRMKQVPGDVTIEGINGDLGISQVWGLSTTADGAFVLAGMQDNGTVSAGDGTGVETGDGGHCFVDPVEPTHQVATSQGMKTYWTADGWTTPLEITPSQHTVNDYVHGAFIAPVVADPLDPETLYGADNYLYRWDLSTNPPTVRQHLGGQLLAAGAYVQCIGIGCDASHLYTGSVEGELQMSTDRGDHWTRIDTGLPVRAITGISPEPGNPTSVLVALSGFGSAHLWQCIDTSAPNPVWVSVSGGLPDVPVNVVVRDPLNPLRHWFAGTDIGVFETQNAGSSWADATQPLGLPGVGVQDLKAVPGTLFAGTFGRGVWKIELPVPTYTVATILPAVGYLDEVHDLNDAGVVVGSFSTRDGEGLLVPQAFSFTVTDGFRGLGTIANGKGSTALGINRLGSIVGTAGQIVNAFTVVDVPHHDLVEMSSPGYPSGARSINAGGMIVGDCIMGSPGNPISHVLVWPGPLDLHSAVTSGAPSYGSWAFDINDRGELCGEIEEATTLTSAYVFPLPSGPVQRLGPGIARALNNWGQIVGASDTDLGYWYQDHFVKLNLRLFDQEFRRDGAAAVNERCEIVGRIPEDVGTETRAYVWRNYKWTDLNTLVPPGSGWVLQRATGINNKGQICGFGTLNGQAAGFLLTPNQPY